MQHEYLNVTAQNAILRVLINRPEKRNALSQAVLDEIGATFRHHAADDTLVAAVITGAGERCFAAGGDLREFDALREKTQVERMAGRSADALDAIRDFPVPVVAALNGDALGGGAELAVACDLRVFATHARIAFVQGTLCISPAWGGGADLVRIVGGSRALKLLARGDLLTAAQAEAIGLADWVAAPGETLEACLAGFMGPIAERKPQVMRAFKSLVAATRKGGDRARIRNLEQELLATTWLHPDHWAAAEKVLARIAGGAK
ncbi:MAG: enoyl-CoA hydratase/isomerase family protein [Gammaproteobacteria bacterium]|nr:enoyl-CoA hydratase/isomerase family protein [Gammaproteobacteria bacterium]